ncbi:MAG: extracellular solute-binding protein [Brachybacterium sp.]|uniref:extracellular solute-binding protein n=1 Tax=Brachybacterium sp. TaxID=1891286 RepID=UPI002649215E|nr:extracellular solute-binding protein [Brachybacterium sp.]MDN5688164.1 extracellular solute-binding protein [Brachybacterium sp.]
MSQRFTRRSLMAAGGIAPLAALAACSGEAPGGGAAIDNAAGIELPHHTPPPELEGAIISDVEGVPPGYEKLPTDLIKTVEKPPGDGGPITEFKISWDPPAPPLEANAFWQSYNERLNVDYQPSIAPAANYDERLATLLAGGDLPDIVQLLDTAQSAKAISNGAFADLTSYLAGDKIDQWPNLATIREEQWRYVAYDGKIVGFPIDLPAYNNEFRYRRDWAEENGYPDPPADAEEFKELFASFSKMGVDGRYGLADAPGTAMVAAQAMFQVPPGWRYEDGKLTHHIETDEYEAAVRFMTELWDAGAFHPDALALDSNVGKTLSMIPAGTVGLSWIAAENWYIPGVYHAAVEEVPDSWTPFVPPAFDGSGSGLFARSTGVFARVAISAQAAEDEEHLMMLLDFCNYMRAPFGSEEQYFLYHGEDGDYFTRDPGEQPVPVEGTDWHADAGQLIYGLPPVIFDFEGAADAIAINEEYVKNSQPNPVAGLFSASATKAGPRLDELAQSYVNQIIVGNRPLSDLEAYREQWRSRGGDDMRTEYLEALKSREDQE